MMDREKKSDKRQMGNERSASKEGKSRRLQKLERREKANKR